MSAKPEESPVAAGAVAALASALTEEAGGVTGAIAVVAGVCG
jgi:hypothetical protein